MKTLKHNSNDDAEQMVLDLLKLMADGGTIFIGKASCIRKQAIHFEFYNFDKWHSVSVKTKLEGIGKKFMVHEIAIDENRTMNVKFPIGQDFENPICHIELKYHNAFYREGQIVHMTV